MLGPEPELQWGLLRGSWVACEGDGLLVMRKVIPQLQVQRNLPVSGRTPVLQVRSGMETEFGG